MNGRLDALDPPPLQPDAAPIAVHNTNNNDGGGGGDASVEPENAAAAAVHGFTSQARAEAEALERHEEELRKSVGQYLPIHSTACTALRGSDAVPSGSYSAVESCEQKTQIWVFFPS